MKRREFVTNASLLASGAVGWSGVANAQAAAFAEGTDFQSIEPRVAVEGGPGKIEVIEFFWYNCPHCNAFEPTLANWIKQIPKDVYFHRVPVAFRDDFVAQQRFYFALEAMGLVEKLHAKVFAAIHVEKLELTKPESILNWVGKAGVNVAKFQELFNSFSVAAKATRATQLQNAYRVEGVPALGVAGRYYTDGSLAKGMDRALKVVEFLLATTRHGK